ncbi:hypothetical protein HanIR_Chr14g0715371 [Helianthus annuus]|nr:hypothetical protein HanIR_Chr14g0715371 [Helianthus annuus]
MTGGKFTFVSDNVEVKMRKIDRFLVCADFMNNWPLAKLEVQKRGFSDHCPLALTCFSSDFGPTPFKFFNSWIGEQRLVEIVERNLAAPIVGEKRDVYLANTQRKINQDIKQWRKEANEAKKKEVQELQAKIEEIEKKTESLPLSQSEKSTRVELSARIKKFEAIKAKNLQQKARVNWIRFGDENSSFFHSFIV